MDHIFISLYVFICSESIVRVEVKGHQRMSSQLKKPFNSLRPRLDTYWAKCERSVFLISFYLPFPPNNRLLATFLGIITNWGFEMTYHKVLHKDMFITFFQQQLSLSKKCVHSACCHHKMALVEAGSSEKPPPFKTLSLEIELILK